MRSTPSNQSAGGRTAAFVPPCDRWTRRQHRHECLDPRLVDLNRQHRGAIFRDRDDGRALRTAPIVEEQRPFGQGLLHVRQGDRRFQMQPFAPDA
jgi:hypothetical protein